MSSEWPDFRNMTKQEAIEHLKRQQDPKLEPLIKWIAEAEAFFQSSYAIQVAIADSQRLADRLRSSEPKEQASSEDVVLGEWVYCSQHLRPHRSGWCTVSLADKIGLGPTASEREAYEKCRRLGLKLASE